MGYRTTVILYNDQAHQWGTDPNLGQKIHSAMHAAMGSTGGLSPRADLGYGRVVECTHADEQTLAILDSYSLTPVSYSRFMPGQDTDAIALKLVKEAAAKLGYKLIVDKSKLRDQEGVIFKAPKTLAQEMLENGIDLDKLTKLK